MKSEVYSQSTCIVSTAAYQYYIEWKKRSEIAESLGLSPSTLSRVLKRAKEEGIIEIKVTEPFLSCNIMEKEEMIDTIKQIACSLAEKELIAKYGKLPEQLMTERGTYRSKYQDEFNKLYDKYEYRLIRLSGKNADELFVCE